MLDPDEVCHPTTSFRTVASFDAFNQCDPEKFGSLIVADLEFYHDKSGMTRWRQALVEVVRNNICNTVTTTPRTSIP